jgi:hypothetical protein
MMRDRSDGVMEYWSNEKEGLKSSLPNTPSLQYSSTPVLRGL